MTWEMIGQIVESVQRRRNGITQTPEQISAMYAIWRWPNNSVVPSDDNLLKLTEHALLFNGWVEPRTLDRAYQAIRGQLAHYTPPKEAPVIQEPSAPAPVQKTQDQLGEAKSVEAGIEHHQQAPQSMTPISDAVKYSWNTGEYKQQLEIFRREARAAAIQNGVLNHAKEAEIFNKKKDELDAQIENAKRNPIDLVKLEHEAYEKARRGKSGNHNSADVVNRFKDGLGQD